MKLAVIALGVLVASGNVLTVPSVGAEEERGVPPIARDRSSEIPSASYADLVDLTGRICAEAAESFRGFFDSSHVRVRPFIHVNAMANDSSVLGVMLADHIAAMLNGHANAGCARAGDQRLKGVLQEVDGYLHIHVLGTNGRGECRSHLAMVEMSAPLYRALHTYTAIGRSETAHLEKTR